MSVDFVALANDLTELSLLNPFGGALSFNSFFVSGVITSDGTITLVLKEDSRGKKIYLIYHKPSEEAAQKAIAADFPKVRFSSLISQMAGAKYIKSALLWIPHRSRGGPHHFHGYH